MGRWASEREREKTKLPRARRVPAACTNAAPAPFCIPSPSPSSLLLVFLDSTPFFPAPDQRRPTAVFCQRKPLNFALSSPFRDRKRERERGLGGASPMAAPRARVRCAGVLLLARIVVTAAPDLLRPRAPPPPLRRNASPFEKTLTATTTTTTQQTTGPPQGAPRARARVRAADNPLHAAPDKRRVAV